MSAEKVNALHRLEVLGDGLNRGIASSVGAIVGFVNEIPDAVLDIAGADGSVGFDNTEFFGGIDTVSKNFESAVDGYYSLAGISTPEKVDALDHVIGFTGQVGGSLLAGGGATKIATGSAQAGVMLTGMINSADAAQVPEFVMDDVPVLVQAGVDYIHPPEVQNPFLGDEGVIDHISRTIVGEKIGQGKITFAGSNEEGASCISGFFQQVAQNAGMRADIELAPEAADAFLRDFQAGMNNNGLEACGVSQEATQQEIIADVGGWLGSVVEKYEATM